MNLHHNILSYLRRHAPEALDFWTVGGTAVRPGLLAVCDTFYSLKLVGALEMLAPDAAPRFALLLGEYRLAGGIGHGRGAALNVHKTAYALGVLNFLAAHGRPAHQEALRDEGWRNAELLDDRHRPRWPWYFTHHAWRVGHWIGGIPAEEPVILCGDFNTVPRSEPYRMAAARLRDVQRRPHGRRTLKTFSSSRPLMRLDHIFVSSHLEAVAVAVPRTTLTRVASDHLPLLADLQVAAAGADKPTTKRKAPAPSTSPGRPILRG